MLEANTLDYQTLTQTCHNHGGFLPEPKNEIENQFLNSLDTEMFPLGMSDNKAEGQWIWASDGSPVTWTSWIEKWSIEGDGEPDGGTEEGCAAMLRNHVAEFPGHRIDGWIDYPCDGVSRKNLVNASKSLICQRNAGMWMSSLFLLILVL